MKQLKIFILNVFILFLLFSSCTYNNEVDYFKVSTNQCDTINMSFQTNVYPVINTNCVNCHGNSGASGHINLEGYSNVKTNLTVMMKAIKHQTGVPPMPLNAAKLSDCDINKISAWIDQGLKNN